MAEYYYTQGTDRHGPIDLAELQSLVSSGQVTGTEYYWTTGMADWATVNTSSLFSAPQASAPSDVETPSLDAMTTDPVADVPSAGDPIPSTLTGVPPGDTSPSPSVPAAGGTPAAAWSPSPVSPAPPVQSDQGTVQRIAAKMPKPLWLIVNGIVTGLSGVFLILGIFTIPFAAVVIWMAVMLFKANTSLENARRTGSLESLEKAASNLNTYFAIITIMTILSIVITLIAFVAIGANLSEFTRF
jgi:uncharacterized membrane protein YphA (DoxX/SURF4 family)